ncbi:MAG: thioredoxin family protein [Pirellulales bacterium]
MSTSKQSWMLMTVHSLLVGAVLLTVATEVTSGSEGLSWQTDLEAAQRTARESGRLVLLHFGGPWCEPCRRLEQQVFSQPGFGRDLAARYVAVKVDPRQQPKLAEKYGVHAVPTDVVTTARGQLVMKVESPDNAAAYSATLNRIADNVLPAANPVAATSPPRDSASAVTPSRGQLDRYADYYNRRKPLSPSRDPGASAASDRSSQPSVQNPAPATVATAAYGPNRTSGDHKGELAGQQPSPSGHCYLGHYPNGAAEDTPPVAAHPPFALDRYCAVTLVEKRRWEVGDERWGAIHRGRTYLFVSEDAQKAFLANPDRYSPVFAGNDPVMRVDFQQDVPGKREHGAFYNNRIYLFTSEDTFHRFDRDPARYTADATRQIQRR